MPAALIKEPDALCLTSAYSMISANIQQQPPVSVWFFTAAEARHGSVKHLSEGYPQQAARLWTYIERIKVRSGHTAKLEMIFCKLWLYPPFLQLCMLIMARLVQFFKYRLLCMRRLLCSRTTSAIPCLADKSREKLCNKYPFIYLLFFYHLWHRLSLTVTTT